MLDQVWIVERIEGYDYGRSVERLRVTRTFEKAVDWVSQEYPDFKRIAEAEWVSEEPMTETTARIYISLEVVW